MANLRFQDDPAFGAVAQVVDTVTGAVRSLDGILRTTGAQFGHFAWQPGTERVAVTATVGGVTTSWLLDLDRDVASRLALDGHQYVTGWSPDGAALIVTTNRSLIGDLGAGPDTLSAVTFSATGQPHLTTLTQAAYTFPFVGFVPTA